MITASTDVYAIYVLFSQLNADNAAVYDTVIFAGPPPMKQRLWPRHCVQDTWGSELHKDLKVC
jgi:nicotinamidase-related amidase